MGKDRHVYLVNRDNLGGITAPVASVQLGNSPILQAAVTYRTKQGTYVAFRAEGAQLSAFRITAANPPTIVNAWTVNQNGCGSPFVTSTDGTSNMIVWMVGTVLAATSDCTVSMESTGAVVFAGGGPNELMEGTHGLMLASPLAGASISPTTTKYMPFCAGRNAYTDTYVLTYTYSHRYRYSYGYSYVHADAHTYIHTKTYSNT